MIQCVISDLGKVILFFDNFIFFQKIAEYCPYSYREIAERVHRHKDIIRSFDTGKIEPENFYREVIHALEAKIGQDTFFHIYSDVERFGFIKMKFPEIFLFDDYILSYEVGYMKPHPEIYIEALKKARARAEECVFLDDLPENIEGAQRLGMNSILYGPQIDLEVKLKQMNVTI